MYAKNTEKVFPLNILEYSLWFCSDDVLLWPTNSLGSLACFPPVVLVVGTYQSITNHITYLRFYRPLRLVLVKCIPHFSLSPVIVVITTKHKQPFGKSPL